MFRSNAYWQLLNIQLNLEIGVGRYTLGLIIVAIFKRIPYVLISMTAHTQYSSVLV
jgi:hypothetical protein